jgi:hypothetical protein
MTLALERLGPPRPTQVRARHAEMRSAAAQLLDLAPEETEPFTCRSTSCTRPGARGQSPAARTRSGRTMVTPSPYAAAPPGQVGASVTRHGLIRPPARDGLVGGAPSDPWPGDESVLQLGRRPRRPRPGRPPHPRARPPSTAPISCRREAYFLPRRAPHPSSASSAGEVETGPEARDSPRGQRVMALLAGGGYAGKSSSTSWLGHPVPTR